MASMFKKEVLVRPISSVSIPAAIEWTKSWLDNFYDEEEPDVTYFADIYDPRGKHSRIIRVFHVSCVELYSMDPDQLVFNLLGDASDPGLDDSHLDEEEAGDGDFILSEDPLYKTIRSDVDSLQLLHDSDQMEEGDPSANVGETVNEETVKAWMDAYMAESPSAPAGSEEVIVDLLERIARLEEQLADPANIEEGP